MRMLEKYWERERLARFVRGTGILARVASHGTSTVLLVAGVSCPKVSKAGETPAFPATKSYLAPDLWFVLLLDEQNTYDLCCIEASWARMPKPRFFNHSPLRLTLTPSSEGETE